MHQIRSMISILFLIGNGLEDATVLTDLFDIKKFPKKPQYPYASPYPLVLSDCVYENLKFEKKPKEWVDIYQLVSLNLKEDLIDNQLKMLLLNNLNY